MKCELNLFKVQFVSKYKKTNGLMMKFKTQKRQTKALLGLLVEKSCSMINDSKLIKYLTKKQQLITNQQQLKTVLTKDKVLKTIKIQNKMEYNSQI